MWGAVTQQMGHWPTGIWSEANIPLGQEGREVTTDGGLMASPAGAPRQEGGGRKWALLGTGRRGAIGLHLGSRETLARCQRPTLRCCCLWAAQGRWPAGGGPAPEPLAISFEQLADRRQGLRHRTPWFGSHPLEHSRFCRSPEVVKRYWPMWAGH